MDLPEPLYFENEQIDFFFKSLTIIEKRRKEEPICLRIYNFPSNPTYSTFIQSFPNLKTASNYGKTHSIQIRLRPGHRPEKR